MTGRWLVDIYYTEAIYQPLTHFPTTRYTPAGRYGGFFRVYGNKNTCIDGIFCYAYRLCK